MYQLSRTVPVNEPKKSFLDTGLDFSTDDLSPSERAVLVAWYRENHGAEDL